MSHTKVWIVVQLSGDGDFSWYSAEKGKERQKAELVCGELKEICQTLKEALVAKGRWEKAWREEKVKSGATEVAETGMYECSSQGHAIFRSRGQLLDAVCLQCGGKWKLLQIAVIRKGA